MNDEEMSGELTFAEFQRVSAERSARWHPGGVNEWSDAEWIVCLTGELGELCGWLKERWRNRDRAQGKGMTTREIDTAIRKEVADVLAYLCMFAESEGIDLAKATVSKFNEVSERFGFPERLEDRRNKRDQDRDLDQETGEEE